MSSRGLPHASFRLTARFFVLATCLVVVFLLSYFFPSFLGIAQIFTAVLVVLGVLDALFLFGPRRGIDARRPLPDRLSNGDKNPISIHIANAYAFAVSLEVIDELPYQFQLRNQTFKTTIPAGSTTRIAYQLRPTERGGYSFGYVHVYATSPLNLVQRSFRIGEPVEVPVYPSFLQMQRFEIMAASNRLHEFGVKKIRRIGHTMEFERIKEYVVGDDPAHR